MGEYGYGPDVAIDGAGRFVVVWADEHEGTDVNPLGVFASVGDVRALPGD